MYKNSNNQRKTFSHDSVSTGLSYFFLIQPEFVLLFHTLISRLCLVFSNFGLIFSFFLNSCLVQLT